MSNEDLSPQPSADETSARAQTSAALSARDDEQTTRGDDGIDPPNVESILPMVALGGSAGSFEALQTFFDVMPADSGMVFVVVMHLSPDHDSALSELLQRRTRMPVVQTHHNERVEADHVYVIPPAKLLSVVDGSLWLTDLPPTHGKRVTVDLFFRTLADTHGARAVAIVLSGADGDGAIGIKRIKEFGGLTIVQDPEEASHPGMPRSAIATGMVDWVLPVAEMPARLMQYKAQERRLRLPSNQAPPVPVSESEPDGERAFRELLVYVRTRTGRDFTSYKRATILRRVARRMQVNAVDDLRAYLTFLRAHAGEATALLQELLISVTNFFRDPHAFLALEACMPRLFEGKGANDVVRAWVPACATGEEAYSIAMLLQEHAARLDSPPAIQVFATDLDEEVIRTAREGNYPEAIEADVSEERLRRFFTHVSGGYRVRREVRETVLFAVHDVLRDSPFSRLDLVSCRNLLIYLTRDAQMRALQTFHFALRSGACLFLGTSESIDDNSHFFATIDKKHRLYSHRPTSRMGSFVMPESPVDNLIHAAGSTASRSEAASHAREPGFYRRLPSPTAHATSWSELHLKLVEALSPPSVIVNQEHDIVHMSEHAGRYLQFTGGEPTKNLLRAINPGLRIELRTALYRVAQTGAPIEITAIPVEIDGARVMVDMRVSPAGDIAPDYQLIVFDGRISKEGVVDTTPSRENDTVTRHLERELEATTINLRDIVEQYESSTEELKSSNEELQAMNEELRSATEELETSREELQSINEELTTVNGELKSKVDELASANSDLHNLIGATAIATVFLDRELCITRYTPSAVALFNLIPTDIGRPLTDLKHRMDYPEMDRDARAVLDQLAPVRREVGAGEDWYLARLLPYRTLEDRIGGVVLTFVDITERRRNEESLRESEDRFRSLVHSSTQVLFRLSPDWKEMRTLQDGDFAGDVSRPSFSWIDDFVFLDDRNVVVDAIRQASADHAPFVAEFRFRRKDNTWRWVVGRAIPRFDEAGRVVEWFGAASDISAERAATESLRTAHAELEQKVTARTEELFEANSVLEREITERKRAETARRVLFQRLVGVQEEERRRIARELHDVLGQHLTALDVGLKASEQVAGCPPEVVEKLEYLRGLIQTTDDEVERLSHELRPRALDDLGLGDALRRHVAEWTRQSGITVDLHVGAIESERLPAAVEVTLYRLVQEALTNILKHAAATTVSVIVERRGDEVLALIEDDGLGFDDAELRALPGAAPKLGLRGMEERVIMAGGRFNIESRPKSGTAIYAHLPAH